MRPPLSATLTDLIGVAEQVVTKPARYPGSSLSAQAFAAIAADVREADARPAENIRTTTAAMIMVLALEEFHGAGATSENLSNPWLMIAGATLPLLRVDAWRAFNNEKQARGS
jgi:hypothetical protein